jgi:hypothetical protein
MERKHGRFHRNLVRLNCAGHRRLSQIQWDFHRLLNWWYFVECGLSETDENVCLSVRKVVLAIFIQDKNQSLMNAPIWSLTPKRRSFLTITPKAGDTFLFILLSKMMKSPKRLIIKAKIG